MWAVVGGNVMEGEMDTGNPAIGFYFNEVLK
jgi:hypothetical protein